MRPLTSLRRCPLDIPPARQDFLQCPFNSVDGLLQQTAGFSVVDLVAIEHHDLESVADMMVHLGHFLQAFFQKLLSFVGSDLILQEENTCHQSCKNVAEEKNADPGYTFPQQQTVKSKAYCRDNGGKENK